jgi:hypothetical protein
MTSDSIEDKYPHWKDALFGNHNAVANIRCAIHYVFWHLVYALIAVVGALIVGCIIVAEAVAPYLGPFGKYVLAGLSRAKSGTARFLNHPYTERAAQSVLYALLLGFVIWLVVAAAYSLYTQFWTTIFAVIGGAVILGAVLGVLILAEYLYEPAVETGSIVATKANSAGKRAVKTPGIRRVYGKCPVSIKQQPKWFQNIFPLDEE